MSRHLLLTVAESYRLPGLGLLAIGRRSEPVLRQFALHTKLEVQLLFPDGHQQTVPASAEEITRPLEATEPNATPAERTDAVVLLETELVTNLPPGTEIWWSGEAALSL